MNIQKIINAIENSGYLNVNGVVRRWIPSQCLNMIFSEEGFHQQLKNRKYNYSWKVLMISDSTILESTALCIILEV